MPHVIVEYSANLANKTDPMVLLAAVKQGVLDTGLFSTGGTRVRAARRDEYLITDEKPENAFCHIQLKIGTGRDPEICQAAAKQVFEAARDHLQTVFDTSPFCLSLEVIEIPKPTAFVHNNMKGMPCPYKRHT